MQRTRRLPRRRDRKLKGLEPGRYVILAQYVGRDVSTFVDVSVAPGRVAVVELPDTCK